MLKVLCCVLLLLSGPGLAWSQEPAAAPAVSTDSNERKSLEIEKFDQLQKISMGTATLDEVRDVLSNTNDVAGLTNTVHILYSMRWNRGILELLGDLWSLRKDRFPELAWPYLEKIPVRLALASTINRIQIYNTDEYKNFIRAHRYDEHEFHRAQVVISLGLNGDPVDVHYVKEMAESDNVYVAQSAITSLALMANTPARNALIELARKYTTDERGKLVREVFKKAYPVNR